MNKSKLYFQLSFSKSSENTIKRLYNLSSSDEILLAVWLSGNGYSIFERRGFIISKEGLSWNYPAVAETTDSKDSAKERVPRNSNGLSKSDIRFLGTDFRDIDVAGREDKKREIQVRISGTLFIFAFDSEIPQEKIVLLERAIASNFADSFDPTNFEKADDSYSLPLTLITIKDYFINIVNEIKNKLYDFKLLVRQLKNEKAEAKEKSRKNEESKNTAVKTVNKVGAFFRHIVDFFTDMMLMFAILIFVKPQLLVKDFLSGVTATISGITVSLFYYDISGEITQEIIGRRNFIFIVLASLYLILKIFISLSCRKNRKAVTALLFIMLIADFLLVREKFIIFIILLLLILLAMQFSMGFATKVVKFKVIFFALACIIGYIVLHIVLYADFTAIFKSLISLMTLPVRWW